MPLESPSTHKGSPDRTRPAGRVPGRVRRPEMVKNPVKWRRGRTFRFVRHVSVPSPRAQSVPPADSPDLAGTGVQSAIGGFSRFSSSLGTK